MCCRVELFFVSSLVIRVCVVCVFKVYMKYIDNLYCVFVFSSVPTFEMASVKVTTLCALRRTGMRVDKRHCSVSSIVSRIHPVFRVVYWAGTNLGLRYRRVPRTEVKYDLYLDYHLSGSAA